MKTALEARTGIPHLLMLLVPLLAAAFTGTIVLAGVPLEWSYTGYDLYPGVTVGVSLQAEAERWLTSAAAAPAAVSFGDVEAGVYTEQDSLGLGLEVYFAVYDGGREVARVDLPEPGVFSELKYDAELIIEWPCNSSKAVQLTYSIAGERRTVTVHPGDPPARLSLYSVRIDNGIWGPSVESRAQVTESIDAGCWEGPGRAPPTGLASEGGVIDESTSTIMLAAAGAAAGALLFLLTRRGE